MRRILLTAGAALALSLTSAGAAMAHHSHGRAASRHAARHHRHHHAHIVRFASPHAATTPSSSTPATSTPASESVATVASFANGVLTLTLADGSTVSGKVTEDTRIECRLAAGEQEGDDDQGEGDDNHGGPGPSSGFGGQGQGDDMHGSSQGQGGDDGGQGAMQSCGPSALAEGAKVAEAELRVGAGGASWEKVEVFG